MDRKRVLVVDDEPDVVALLAELLNEDDRCSDVQVALDLATALELVAEACPDVIITDFSFGRRARSEIIPALREQCPQARIIVHTANGYLAMQAGVIDLGADLVLQKVTISLPDVVDLVLR
jgi:two-component system nitrate/nitrite response regulator NarL